MVNYTQMIIYLYVIFIKKKNNEIKNQKKNKRLYHDIVFVVDVDDKNWFVIKVNNFIHVNSCFIVHSLPLWYIKFFKHSIKDS